MFSKCSAKVWAATICGALMVAALLQHPKQVQDFLTFNYMATAEFKRDYKLQFKISYLKVFEAEYFEMNANYARALEIYSSISESGGPDSLFVATVLHERAMIEERLNKWDEAAVSLSHSIAVLQRRGFTENSGLAKFEYLLDRRQLADIFLLQGKNEQSIGLYESNLSQANDWNESFHLKEFSIHQWAFECLAKAYSKLGQNDKALRTCTRAIAALTAEKCDTHILARSLIDLGIVRRDNGLFVDAIKSYKDALDLEPNNDLAYACLAQSYSLLNQRGDALKCATHALELNSHQQLASEIRSALLLKSQK